MRSFSYLLFALIAAVIAVPVSATIIDVPDDYSTIQEGIDASNDGDTVLVQPGTYVENINFSGHNIVLGSMYLTTEDTSYIAATIVDGDSSGSVVTFDGGEDSTAVITGFTIRNGYSYEGGGIYCHAANPTISKNHIMENVAEPDGGGIYCHDAAPLITDNNITGNIATGWWWDEWGPVPEGMGGGIYLRQSDAEIINNIIVGNDANSSAAATYCYASNPQIVNNIIGNNSGSGGICCSHSDPLIRGNTISANFLDWTGGGITCYDSNPVVSNTILWGNWGFEVYADSNSFPTFSYCDIRGGWEGEGNIDINPLIVDPENRDFNICAQSPCIDAGDPSVTDPDGTRSDIGAFFPDHPECEMGNTWFVSVSGDDNSGDGSPGNPFRTIQHGIDMAFHRDTVIVEIGIYVENITCPKNIVLASNYIFTQDTLDIQNTVIDGDSGRVVITMVSCDSLSAIAGLTIRNGSDYYGHGIHSNNSDPTISHNVITGNSGNGISGYGSKPYIINNTISSNSEEGVSCGNSTIINNVIIDNSRSGIICYGPDALIVNNIIGGNLRSGIGCSGSNAVIMSNTISFNNWGIRCYNNSDPIITNTIVWGNFDSEIIAYNGNPLVSYSDIGGGWEGEGNIDEDPLLIDPISGNYNVCAGSPCIDAGDPNIADPDGSRSDIGVFFLEHPECIGGNRWYVSVDGDDNTGDGSHDNPFRTIQHGIDVSYHRDTVIVENGSYIENITCAKNIVLASNYIFTRDTLDIQNTIIDGDSLDTVVIFLGCNSTALVTGFTVTNGFSRQEGGGIGSYGSEVRIEDNFFTENTGSGIYCDHSSSSIVNNTVSGNAYSYYENAGIKCVDSEPVISNNLISNNPYSGILCDNSSPVIIFNTITSNSAAGYGVGGGISCNEYSSPMIRYNTISGNSSEQRGGGILCNYASNAIIRNNIISYNSAEEGGGILSRLNSNPALNNNVIFGNSGGGLSADAGIMVNCILRSNTPYEIEGAASVSFCNVEGGWNGSGNVDVEPLFRDPQNNDFHLMAVECGDSQDSPCIDMGHPLFLDSLLSCSSGLGTDRSDMGAYGGGDETSPGNDIQAAIDASTDGDTVIIEPGMYFERINFNGRNIVLGSLFLTTGDTSYISSTIIAGYTSGSIVTFNSGEFPSTVIAGFTIQGGYADNGAGIYCANSSPTIKDNVMTGNSAPNVPGYGGAVYCVDNANAVIINNRIVDNYGKFGGGIACNASSSPTIAENTISNNSAYFGGGAIYCKDNSSPDVSYNTIHENSANNYGGAIYCYHQCGPMINNNIISDNSCHGRGGGICLSGTYPNDVVITVNTISGNTADSLGGGIYSAGLNEMIDQNDIIENWASLGGGGIYAGSGATVINNYISDNSTDGHGGGIYCPGSNPTINNNIINGNSADGYGGGICTHGYGGNPSINNNLIIDNLAHYGGGLSFAWCEPTVNNCSFSSNTAIVEGGAVYADLRENDDPVFANSILWADSAPEGPEIYPDNAYRLDITYSNIEGGYGGEGNIDIDPLFRDAESGDFHLMFTECSDSLNSPCIDAGHPDSSDAVLDCMRGLGTARGDMGAYGGMAGQQTDIEEDIIELPAEFRLAQNFPNPFNPTTIIEFDLPKATHVSVEIFDILGRKAETLLDDHRPAGKHRVTFDASAFASGVYFYRVQAGDMTETKKMMLLR